MQTERDPRINAIPDIHGHAKGEHKPYTEERPLPLTARMLFLWFYHACRRGSPRFLMVADHMNYLTFEDPAAVNLVRRALKLAQAGDLYGAAETANVDVAHAQIVSEGLRRGMRYSIGAEVDNDPRARPDAQNIVDAMRPDGLIRSIHFLPIEHPVHGPNWNWPFDNPEFSSLYDHVGTEKTWETYMTVLLDAIERLSGNIIGHFYVPAKFGHWPDDATLEGYEDRFIDAVAARGMAIEFNTRFLYGDHTVEEKAKYLDANRRLLRKAQARGVGIAIGSDAHSPRDQGNGFATVLEILDELEINEIVFPIAGRLARVALRFVKPPEPVAPPAPPPPEPVVAARAMRPSPEDDEALEPAAAPAVKPARKRPPAKAPVVAEADVPLVAEPVSPAAAPAAATPDAPVLHAVETGMPSAVPPAILVEKVRKTKPTPIEKPMTTAKPAVVKLSAASAKLAATASAALAPAAAKATVAKPVRTAPIPAPKPAAKALPPKPIAAPAKKAAPVKPALKPAAKKKPAVAKAVAAKTASGKKPKAKTSSKTAPPKKTSVKPPAKPAAKIPARKKPAAAKSPATKKAAPKKVAPRPTKPAAKRPPAKKTAPRPLARATAKKAPARKAVAKKIPAKKTATKRR